MTYINSISLRKSGSLVKISKGMNVLLGYPDSQ